MASASERWESRLGDVSADRTGFGASREFTVTIDSIGDNPDDVLRDPTTLDPDGNAIAVPFNSPHPTRAGLFAAFYSVETRLKALMYVVRVIYAPPVDFSTSANPWELSYQTGFTTAPINHDNFGNPIGPASYGKADLGPHPQGTVLYSVTIPGKISVLEGEDSIDPKEIELVRLDQSGTGVPRKPIRLHNLSRTEPAGSFSLSKTFPGIQTSMMSLLVLQANKVSNRAFFGFPAGTVKFVGPNALAGVGQVPETNGEGFVFRVTLAFEWNSLGYRWTAQDELTVEGQRLPVLHASGPNNGKPVIREWQLYPEGDLNNIPTLAEQFASYARAVNIGIYDPPRGAGRPPRGPTLP
jgi:hypothetical protein